jgi:hypothetical protein
MKRTKAHLAGAAVPRDLRHFAVPGVSGEITKEGVDIEVGKPKN